MMSSRRGLAQTSSRLPMKDVLYYVLYSHFDLCLRLCGCLVHHDVIKLIPLYVIIWALCDDVQLCNRCVREFLILARTWFTFGLPSKTRCDISGIKAVLTIGLLT
jgi:hypothetical protein